MTAYGEVVTVHRRVISGADGYNNDVYSDVDENVRCIAFAPGVSVEVTQGRDTITTQPTVYLPFGTAIDGVSSVTAQGVRYEVDGQPRQWRSPFGGWAAGVEVRLRVVSG